MKFEITKEMLLKAQTYMPLKFKQTLSRQIAENCVEKMPSTYPAAHELFHAPKLAKENPALKSVLLLNTLLGFYFDITVPSEDENGKALNSYKVYDGYACSHPLNQLERFKSDFEVKNIVFDILSDYREFEKMVNNEIYARKTAYNDTPSRVLAFAALSFSPEQINKAKAEIIRINKERKETEESINPEV